MANFNRGLLELARQYERMKVQMLAWLWNAVMPHGDRIMCRDARGGNRVVDRSIWAKLDKGARSRWIERIATEQRELATA